MYRVIQEVRPDWIVGENVPGFINWSRGMVFEQAQADLEAAGYEVQPYVLPACGVDAPHKRYRVWIVAHANSNVRSGGKDGEYPTKKREYAQRGAWERNGIGSVAHTDSRRRGEGAEREYDNAREREVCENEQGYGNEVWSDIGHGLHDGTSPDTTNGGYEREREGVKVQGGKQGSEQGGQLEGGLEGFCVQGTSSDPMRGRQPGEEHGEAGPRWLTEEGLPNDWRDFPTQPPVRRGNDGFSEQLVRAYIVENSGGILTEKEIDRLVQNTFSKFYKEAIKAFGNAIVPQVAEKIFRAINEYEKLT